MSAINWIVPSPFSSDGFMPHGHCYLWNPGLIWLHVISDVLIALAYTTIPFTLVYLARKRRDIPFNGMFFSFGMFIIACGATHAMEVWTLWVPLYWLSGAIKAVTALASIATAVFLVRLVPGALAIPRSSDLVEAHDKLRKANQVLENRTAELSETLREREALLKERTSLLGFLAIFDSAPFAMALTKMPERVIINVNDAFLKVFDFARDEVVGKTSVDLRLADSESQGRVAQEFRDRGVVRDFECVRRKKSGARVDLLLNVDPLDLDGESYVLTSVRDITKATAAAAELRALVDNLPELAWTARPDGFIDFYNRRWYEYTGTTYEAMQGWGWQSVHDPRELPRVMEGWTRSIATREPFDQAFPLRGKDGVFRWFLTRVAPMLNEDGEIIRWVGINTDVDEQRRSQEAYRQAEQERVRLVEQLTTINSALEDRVRTRTSELSEMLREKEGLLREKTSLLQEVHHRVKNNLQMISSLLNLQARQIEDREARAIFLESQGRVRSIALLHESLYQSDDLGSVDMREYVDKLIGTLSRTYGQTGVSPRFSTLIEDVHLPVDAAVPCGLIVNELVTNALKHAFAGAAQGADNEIRIEMRRTGEELTLVVADNGSGFNAAVDPSSDETMGLPLVRDLSGQLRGSAAFVTDGGATCTVRFPAPTPES